MKKIMGLLALCAIGMASCQKETDTSDLNSQDQALNGITITDLNTGESTTALELGQRHRPERDSSCRKIPIDSLAPSILDYIAVNYPGATIKRAGSGKAGKIVVIIQLADKSLKMLLFDAGGNFVSELSPKDHRKHGKGKHLTAVDITTLLSDITNYIDANYAGASVERAGLTDDGKFVIAISFNGKRKLLLFDENGVFIKELK
ncbi:MAG: hypothetical protein JNL65_12815 [Saprospiraceae bacterium]|nr:hypothetical protein [Saprospiraceae bacterium]HRG68365.1 hypothetical protein [Saprospiraceae bacterium]